MLKPRRTLWAVPLVFVLWVPVGRAQKAAPAGNPLIVPYPPLQMSSGQANTQDLAAAQKESNVASPESQPVTGVQQFALAGPAATHSFLQPGVDFFQQVDTNGLSTTGSGRLVTLSSIFGSLLLQRNSGRSQLTLDYVGGGTFSHNQSGLNSSIHEFEASQATNWRRWTLLLSDQFSYLPESSFGAGAGGVGNIGPVLGGALAGSLPGLSSFLTPNQSVFTSRGGRVSNTFLSQVEYHVSPRASITAAGGYGILRFFEADLLDSGNAIFMTGYNYQVTGHDTLGVLYRFSGIRFGGLDRNIEDHVTQLAYGRRITGRLAFRVSAGPEVTLVRDHAVGSTNGLLWSLDSSLQYGLQRAGLGLSYHHGVTGGAGVLPGAETDQIDASISRGLSRMWSGSLGGGYARNQSVNLGALASPGEDFNTWYGRVQLSRPLGRTTSWFLGYTVQVQNSGTSVCTVASCGTNFVRHLITLGFSWQMHPIVIE